MIFDEAYFITASLSVRLKVGIFAEALAASCNERRLSQPSGR